MSSQIKPISSNFGKNNCSDNNNTDPNQEKSTKDNDTLIRCKKQIYDLPDRANIGLDGQQEEEFT